MYMQDERPYRGPKITSRTQQTDQSYLMKQSQQTTDDKSADPSSQANKQQDNMQDDPTTKPSQTDTSYVYDQYMRDRAPNSQFPTGPRQNFHAMGNIRYPTQFVSGMTNNNVDDNDESTVLLCSCETGLLSKCISQPSVAITNETHPTFASACQPSAVTCLSKSTPDVPSCYKSVNSEPCCHRTIPNKKSDLTAWCSNDSSVKPGFCPGQATKNRKSYIDPAKIVCQSSMFGNADFTEKTPNTSLKDCVCQTNDDTVSDYKTLPEATGSGYCPLKDCQTQSLPFDPCAEEILGAESGELNWQSTKSEPMAAKTCSSKCVQNVISFPFESPSQVDRESSVKKNVTKTTWNTCPSQPSVCSQTPFNKTSIGCTEKTSSRSQSFMAKVTCLCSSEQKANLCKCGRKPNVGPPFARIEDPSPTTDVSAVDPFWLYKGATDKPNHFETQSNKVMFTKSDGYCDCSSSSTSTQNYTNVECDEDNYNLTPKHVGSEDQNESIEKHEEKFDSSYSKRTPTCPRSEFQSMKSCCTCNSQTITSRNDTDDRSESIEKEEDKLNSSCSKKTPPCQRSEFQSMKSTCTCKSKTTTSRNDTENDTEFNSCTTCNRGTPMERVYNMLGVITNTKVCNVERFDMVHQLFRELTSLLRNEEEGPKSTPLSYEECMDAVTSGKKPVENQPKTRDQIQRMECLNQMEQYLNVCFPQRRNFDIPETEIRATEPNPDFNPNDWNEFENNNLDDDFFGECQSSKLISTGNFEFAECDCNEVGEEVKSKTYKSCDVDQNDSSQRSESLPVVACSMLPEEGLEASGSLPQVEEVQKESLISEVDTLPQDEEVQRESVISAVDTDVDPLPQVEELQRNSQIPENDTEPEDEEVKNDNAIEISNESGPMSEKKDKKNECIFDPNDPQGSLTERERLLCEYLLCRICNAEDDEDQTDDDSCPPLCSQPCVCCHCRALLCDNQCKTITKAMDTATLDPVAEMKFFIDSIVFDMQAMEHVMNKNNLNAKTCKPSPSMGNALGESFPVTITDVSSLGCKALYVQWGLHDCSGIGGYEIYVDGHLTNRFYSFRHEAGVVSNVDVTKRHQIVLRAQAIGQEFGIDECERNKNAMVHAHPEMMVGAQQPWSPSVYFYEP